MRLLACCLLAIGSLFAFPALAGNEAAFVTQTVPSVMVPGSTYPVTVTMRNTGNTTWTASALYRLGSQSPQDNSTWGTVRVEMPGDVPPGQTVTFAFDAVAPQTLGVYNFQWRMVQDLVEWFGDYTTNVAVKDGENKAEFVSQSIPAEMIPGQAYQIAVAMRNTGTTVWNASKPYRLGTQNPQDNSVWGLQRVELPATTAPGEVANFVFSVTAPARVGVYNLQFRMVQELIEWFGDYSGNVAVVDGTNSATFESQTVPAVMVPGQSYAISITMRNTGNTTWTAGELYRLGSQNSRDNTTWGLHRVELPSAVPPGQTATFNFNVIAPTTPGTYNFQWQMVEDLVEWFGATTPNVAVKDGLNDAVFVSQTVPNTMTARQLYPVSVTMTNTGTTTWRSGTQFRLGSQHPQDNNTWSIQRAELSADVVPGANTTFTFQVTAPSAAGIYDFQWRMVQELVEWFGGYTGNVAISINPASIGTVDLQVFGVSDGEVIHEGAGIDIEVEATASDGSTVTSTTLTVNGSGVETIHTADQILYQWPKLPEGTHVVTAHAVSDTGASATKTVTFAVIVDPRDIPFRGLLNSLKASLAAGDKAAAMSLLTRSAQDNYGPIFDLLMPFMGQIVSQWSEPRRMFESDDSATYAVVRTSSETREVYIFVFVRDPSGNWLIESM